MKFAMSYSCGKDSTLALHNMIAGGHTPVALLVMVNRAAGRSYFHGADPALLAQYGDALQLPLICCPADGGSYAQKFEEGIGRAIALGAEAVCFGDIDIAANRAWSEDRCRPSGAAPVFPLWQRGRRENVAELLTLGYRCLIKSVNRTLLPESLLGKRLDWDAVATMEARGVDVCGENGEYHTLAVDGPIFRRPIAYATGRILPLGDYPVVEILPPPEPISNPTHR